MLHKILGFILLSPFIAFLLSLPVIEKQKKELGRELSEQEGWGWYFSGLILTIIFQSFCIGIYLLFK